MPPPVIAQYVGMGSYAVEKSMHVYTLTEFNRRECYQEPRVIGYYASKRKADAKSVELSAEQAKEEEEDWITNPCECGDRNCERRDYFFNEWSVEKFDLTELSMRELMKIELADADQD
jgi:heterodisulfide reductase subunit B